MEDERPAFAPVPPVERSTQPVNPETSLPPSPWQEDEGREVMPSYVPHAKQHELTGNDIVRLSVQNQGVQLNRHRTLNFGSGLTATENPTEKRIDVTASGFSRAGGNTVEGATASLTAVDLVVVSGLSIPATTPFLITYNFRKTAGAAASGGFGLTINTTVVHEAFVADTALGWLSTNNQAENGACVLFVGPRVANYLRPVTGVHSNPIGNLRNMAQVFTADLPLATVTSITLRGISGSASVTVGVDEVHVYTLATG